MFVLSTIGMCHIIVDGSIMESFRNQLKDFCNKIGRPNLGSVVDCYLCCGTWCGFFMGMVWVSINPFQVLACGCAGGFLSNLAAVVLNWIESLTYVNLPNEKS
jgi:uncharacterized transporter YbjL